VQLLAIVQSDANFENNRENNSDAREGNANTTNNSTLVVAPLSLLHQWQEEIENKTSLSCRVHYGDRNKNTSAYGSNDTVDVVLTTYGTLQAELRTQRDAGTDKTMPAKKTIILPLLSRNWKRVILDECHIIKNHSTLVAKACCLLRAERRWAVSGTIIQNSLEDVFSLMRYLRHEPFCEHAFWSSAVTKAPDFSVALNRVKKILSPIMIRRTKETRDKTGELILTLPEIDSKSVVVQFSLEERQFYEALYRKSFDIFKGFVRSGTASTSWLKIFSLLHRLRQTCSHVALTVKSQLDDGDWTSNIAQSSSGNGSEASMKKVVEEKDKDSIDQSFLEDLLKKFKCMQNDKSKTTSSQEKNYDNDYTKDEYAISVANMLNQAVQSDSSELNEECPICLENISMNDSAITPCLHIFCKKCLTGFLKNNTQSSGAMTPSLIPSSTQDKSCPICSKYIDSRKILRMTHSSSGKIQTSFLHQRIHDKAKENPNISTEDGDARKTLQTAMKGTSSSKLAAILEELQFVWKKEPGSKVLIFSQFLGFLDIIEKSFESNGIPYRRLDGKLSLKRRMEVLRDFGSEAQQSAPSHNSSIGSVLLISMKAGGVVRMIYY
jgi:DNA repair protein RAD5